MRNARSMGALFAVLALGVAACGSDSDSDSATTDTGSDTTEAMSDTTEAMSETTEAMAETTEALAEGGDGVAAAMAATEGIDIPPADIGPTIPLESVPEVKTVGWLECSLPSCQVIGNGFRAATEALGWNLETISWTTDAAAAAQQAIDLGVDYIAITGTAPELIQDQIDAAADAGIGFYSCFDTADPGQEENNLWIQCGDEEGVVNAGRNIANLIIADSGGDANVLMVNIPDFAVLVKEREGSEEAYAANCPDCTFTELALTLDQLLAGEVPAAIVSAVQADPSIDYIHFAFDGLTGGVAQTLADADLLEGRQLVGVDFSAAVLQEIVDGTQQFWSANPKEYSGWLMVDAMARQAIGQENTEERANAVLPTFVVMSPEQAQPLIATDGWPGPETMSDQFKALWGV